MASKRSLANRGGELLLSFSLVVVGVIFMVLGVTWLPVIGLAIGIGALAMAIYPWTRWAETRVDVRVGEDPDVHFKTKGVIPVVIFSKSVAKGDDYDFDVKTIDGTSVRFGRNRVKPVDDFSDPAVVAGHLVDVDGDGREDFVFLFPREGSDFDETGKAPCIEGRTFDGDRFRGCGERKAA